MALTSLSFLDTGSDWPPRDEAGRLMRYDANRALYEGRHDEVFGDWWRLLREDQGATLEMVVNWPKRLSTMWADLIVGEPPDFVAGERESAAQRRLSRIVDENQLVVAIYDAVIDISRYGDALFKLYRQAGRPVIQVQTPAYWFPVVDEMNVRSVRYHVLAWVYKRTETNMFTRRKDEVEHLRVEIHERGRITHRLFRLRNSQIDREIPVSGHFPDVAGARQSGGAVVEETGVDDFLIVHAPGLGASDRLFGLDDYTDVESVLMETEVRLAQISRILDAHADPNMYGPAGAVETDPRTGATVVEGGGKYYPVDEDDTPPGYVTWDGSLEAAFRELEKLRDEFYLVSETSAAAFGKIEAGVAESGTALRRLMLAPLKKAERLRMRLDPAVKRVLDIALALEDSREEAGIGQVQISWNDGLPEDKKEQADIERARIDGGFGSRLAAIKRMDDVDDDTAAKELGRIREEQGAAQANGAPPPGAASNILEAIRARRAGGQS